MPFENQTICEPDMFEPLENRTSPVFECLLYTYFISLLEKNSVKHNSFLWEIFCFIVFSRNEFWNRYSLVAQESSNEDETAATLDIDVGSYASSLKSQAADINSGKQFYIIAVSFFVKTKTSMYRQSPVKSPDIKTLK